MLSFLASLSRRRQPRGVFRFDGRHFDPNQIRVKLDEQNPQWAVLVDTLAQYNRPMPPGTEAAILEARARNAKEAAAELTRITRSAFSLPPLAEDGSGHTDAQAMGALTSFLDFCRELMESTRPL